MKRLVISALALAGVHGSLSAEQKHDITVATAQTAPGVTAAAGSQALQLPLSDILVICSILFVLLQAAYLIWKWRRDSRREDERQYDRLHGVNPRRGDLPDESDA